MYRKKVIPRKCTIIYRSM